MKRPTYTPAVALKQLLAGNARFVAGESIRANQDVNTVTSLVAGQQPFAAVFGCSDSRVSAELLFDQGFGDLFIIRSAGHVSGSVTQASIEYAIAKLGVKVLLIMGHQNCGAVLAGLELARGGEELEGEMNLLPKNIAKHFSRVDPNNPQEDDPKVAVEDHVRQTLSDLVRDSKIVRDALLSGEITTASGVLNLETGRFELL